MCIEHFILQVFDYAVFLLSCFDICYQINFPDNIMDSRQGYQRHKACRTDMPGLKRYENASWTKAFVKFTSITDVDLRDQQKA